MRCHGIATPHVRPLLPRPLPPSSWTWQAADEEDAELLALQRIDDTSVKLQQEGKYLEALECMERGLVLRQHFFGADSEEVWRACKTVGEMCNLLAMTYLQQGACARARHRAATVACAPCCPSPPFAVRCHAQRTLPWCWSC